MSPPESPNDRLYDLLAAVRRFFALGRSRRRLNGLRLRPTMTGAMGARAGGRPLDTDQRLASHGPIQITTVQGDPMCTQDGITVEITATLAWSRTFCSAVSPRQGTGRSAFDRSAARHDEVSAPALAREALRTKVPDCGLAALLSERHGVEERLRQDIARRAEATDLIVHLVRLRTIDIPAVVRAAGDMRQLSAMRACAERHRRANESGPMDHGAMVSGRLTC